MDLRQVQVILTALLLLMVGIAGAEPNARAEQYPPFKDSVKNDAQSQLEQAADHFDAFVLQMPKVISAKLESFTRHGFRAILMDDPETKPSEEAMIASLVKGLQALGNALSDDLSQPQAGLQEENTVKKQSTGQTTKK